MPIADFFSQSHISGPALSYNYDSNLLSFAVLLIFISSYNILLIVERLLKEWQENKIIWIIAATISFGIGVFSTHFVSLQAINLPISVNSGLSLLLLSIIPALISAIILLSSITRPHLSIPLLMIYSLCFTITLLIMHHLGMHSLQMDATFYYLPGSILSTLIMTFTTTALMIFLLRIIINKSTQKDSHFMRTVAALLMTLSLALIYFAASHGVTYVALEKHTINNDVSNWMTFIAVLVLQMLAILFSVSVFLGRNNFHMSFVGVANNIKVKSQIYRQTLIILLPMLILILVLSAMGLFIYENIKHSKNANEAIAQTDLIASLVVNDFDDIVEELHFQARDPLLADFLYKPNTSDKNQLSNELIALAKVKKIFSQIRILDVKGREIIRIDYDHGKPISVPAHKLQDKSRRYYYQDLLTLEPEMVYVSRFDLNVENEKIDTPIKPMIRFATPIYHPNGEKLGFIMFNYFAQIILNEIQEHIVDSNSKLFLLNAQGFYLIGPTPEQEWGFMYNRLDGFKYDYPQAWKNIISNENGYFIYQDKLFSFVSVGAVSGKNAGAAAQGETERWKVVIYQTASQLNVSILLEHPVSIIFIFVLLVITFFIAWSTALNLVYRKLAEHERYSTLNELNFQKYALDEHAIVSITNARGDITYINEKFVQISGYSRSELLGQNHNLLKSDLHSEQFYHQMWYTIGTGKTWHGEFKNLAKDGSYYWVQSTIVPELDHHGTPHRYISIRTDITHQKNAEARLANAQTIANVGDWKHNLITDKITWSDQCYRIFGYSAGELELKFKNILNAIHPEDRTQFIAAHSKFHKNEANFNIECRIIRPDGEVRYINSMANILRDENQEAILLTGVIHDITSHKLAEKEISKLFQAVESSASIVMVTDINGVIEYINPAFTQITGYHAEEVIGKKTSMLRSESTSEQTYQELWQTIKSGHTWHGEFQNKCKDGHFYWASVTISPVVENGRVTHFTGIQQDITERKMMENQLIQQQNELKGNLAILTESRNQLKQQAKIQLQLKEKAEQADKAKSEFLSAMSHELRTPLNSILGFAQILEYKSEQPLTSTQKVCVDHIMRGGKHLLELINEILDLTKIESGKMQVFFEQIYLYPLVDECLSFIKSIADDRQISIQWATDDLLCNNQELCVQADRMRLKQVILNLLTNAIKYSPKKSQVLVSSQVSANNMLRLEIIDQGDGIPDDKHNELFQPFNRLEKLNSEIEGTGIGLALSKKIIDLLGGQIGFESTYGKGSCFWIDIPRLKQPSPQKFELYGVSDNSQSQVKHQEIIGTLLYIEDNPASQSLMEQVVSQIKGLRLILAHSAESGLKTIQTHCPDLIILDINLPGISGLEAMQQLKQQPETAQIPVIALSANAMPEDIQNGLNAGFKQYLTKPIDINNMLHTIKDSFGVYSILKSKDQN